MTEPAFRCFGVSHLVVMVLTVAVPLGLRAMIGGPGREAARRLARWALAALLVANWLGFEVVRLMDGEFMWRKDLPMQLCDWATVAVIVTLLTRRPGWFEKAYYWGLAGTLQAVLTPDLREGFPSVRFFNFFIGHAGLVAAVLALVWVERMRPRGWASILRVMAWSEVYFLAALAVNAATGENYGFLSGKPPTHSLLDLLSDERWAYWAELNLLAIVYFALLYAPFAIGRAWTARRTEP